MKITIIRNDRDDNVTEPVSHVNVPNDVQVDAALEYAFCLSNSISHEVIENNSDGNPSISRLVPPEEDGLGIRSSSMHDFFMMNGELYEVSFVGFKKLTKEDSDKIFSNLF